MSNESLSNDSLNTLSSLDAGGKTFHYYSLPKAADTLGDLNRLPFSLKVLMENLLRNEDGTTVDRSHIDAMVQWMKDRHSETEIQFRPARVLMQDFSLGMAILHPLHHGINMASVHGAVDEGSPF